MTSLVVEPFAGVISDDTAPALSLSVVLVAVEGMPSIRRTMRHLRTQTARRAMEVILVADRADTIDVGALAGDAFGACRVVAVGPITQRGAAAAAGMLAATTPVVALIEDHSFPEPGWAAALLATHAGSWAGVGPVVENANPTSAMSWVNFILSYGAFSGSTPGGERDILPWHNSAYKRASLDAFGDRLGALLEWEGHLQDELRATGHTLCLEPKARTHHMNVSRFTSTLGLNLQRGRILGAQRADREGWPYWRRLAQAAACPLFPLLQLRHSAAPMREMAIPRALYARVYAGLAVTLCVMAVAEAWGLTAGAGDAIAKLEDYELHRLRHLAGIDLREAALADLETRAPGADSLRRP
ncbi:MAG: hypothetical protein JWL95_593 [Gemmatimonadetes bacterium]|nr:hypothetical protein [Gemmatimonadota bacterium]